ncbi:MAG: fibronectin type III domain-containing protein [Candidatus Nitrosotenuis sp.]|nr:MAG: fibronectin type III domain-containing protein [Candidatus Nitrosotenuis sp.]
MSNNKYRLGTIMAIFVLSMSLTTFQTTGKSNGFAAYAQTASKTTGDSEKLLKDPQFRQKIIDSMKKDHEIAQDLIMAMINDPALRLQLMGHLTESKAAMQDLAKLFGQNATKISATGMIDHGSMSMKDSMKDQMKKDAKKEPMKSDSMKKNSGTMDHGSMSMEKDSMKIGTSANVDFSNVKITNISANSATIQGSTNQAVNCQVEYWSAKDPKHYFASDTGDMMDMKHTDHTVTIKSLMPNTTYNYKFKATLDGKIFYSNQQTFATKAA